MQGGGKLHAIYVEIQSVNLTVDDLGEIIGDNHDLTCAVGNGLSGTTGSGKLLSVHKLYIGSEVAQW